MGVKNPKAKGSAFEREICKKLSLWFSNNTRDDCFWRTASSGARHTIRKKQGKTTEGGLGDICSISSESKIFTDVLAVECKHYKNLNLWSFLTKAESNTYYGFWKEIKKKSVEEEKIPILIARENNKPTLFICDDDFSDRMAFFFSEEAIPKAEFIVDDNIVCVYFFDDILALDIDCFTAMLHDSCTIFGEKEL
jgi:hypothetical protein